MRDIKFRYFSRGEISNTIYKQHYGLEDLETDNYYPLASCVMIGKAQYTELKDSKGVEIYEGDIVEEGRSVGLIVFKDGQFYIDWKFNKDFWNETLKMHNENLDVIGNIYENPKLLKNT